jgi:hypothetical protein
MSSTDHVDENATPTEIELKVEELEEVIAPKLAANHNETVEVDLIVEEMEEVIAPKLSANHNQTLVSD